MTTIAYKHEDREIAYDSRETAGSEIKSDAVVKHYCVDGVDYFLSGSTHCDMPFIKAPKERGFKPEVEIESSGFIVRDGKVFKAGFSDEIGYWELEMKYSDAIGSGGVYAVCAMDLGKGAIDAVEYAKTRDVYTGGKVNVFKVGE